LFLYETFLPRKRKNASWRFFRPFIAVYGEAEKFFAVFCCRGEKRWQIIRFFVALRRMADRDRNPDVFRQLMFQYGT
jgi:hypothetical protein